MYLYFYLFIIIFCAKHCFASIVQLSSVFAMNSLIKLLIDSLKAPLIFYTQIYLSNMNNENKIRKIIMLITENWLNQFTCYAWTHKMSIIRQSAEIQFFCFLHIIGVTTMLNFFTTSNGFRSTLPVVSNLTAMNVWDGVCMGFIYASLLEFVCVNYNGRKRPLHNVVYRPGENPVTQVVYLFCDLIWFEYFF